MTTTISADNGTVSGSAGLKSSADSSGILQFQTGANTTAVTIDASQNVGVGTASPASKLHVVGNVRSSNGAGTLYTQLATDGVYSTGTDLYVFAPTGYANIFYTGGSEKMRLDPSGNLGLGVTPSAWGSSWKAIEVGGKGSSFFSLSAGDNTYLTSNAYFNGTNWIYAYTSLATNYNMAGGVHKWSIAPSGTAGNAITFTQAMTLDASGRLAIGGTSATARLDVQSGWVRIVNGSSSSYLGDGINLVSGASASSSAVRFDGDSLLFAYAPTELMRLTSSGSLILAGSTAQKATGTTWSNPSDQRLKDNIRDYNKGITELMQVRVCEWEYNGKGGTVQGTKGLGVVADEIMVVLPDTVSTYNAKLNTDDEEITAIKKFDATEITWLLVKAIQEQQALIESLTTRLTALEGKA